MAGLSPVGGLCSVELLGITHTGPGDVDVLLVGPGTTQNAIIMSDVGGGTGVSGVNLQLIDSAATPIPFPIVTGTFRPTNNNFGPDTWPGAPLPSGGSALGVFDGADPNGDWNLFVVDDFAGFFGGSIGGGWCVNLAAGCTSNGPCDDGNACNGTETCAAGACTPGAPVPAPSEPLGLVLGPAKSNLAWSSAANATSYDVLRGALNGLPVGPGGGDETCLPSVSSPATTDGSDPAVGTGFWYLIRGRNSCNPAGDYGKQGVHGAPGAARVSTTCS